VKSLAKQLAPKGIRVNGVAPGPIWTALQVSGGATQEKLQQFGANTRMKRPGQPAELACSGLTEVCIRLIRYLWNVMGKLVPQKKYGPAKPAGYTP
jgi:NAD(P)-dependent dehydrogenase (short-subunit alcohol dehydrogenase family)